MNIKIDVAEMKSWDVPSHDVSSQMCERVERNEPSAWEKMRTAQLVLLTERDLKEKRSINIQKVLTMLNQGEDVEMSKRVFKKPDSSDGEDSEKQMQTNNVSTTV